MPRADQSTDRSLAEALMAGDPDAFEPFVERYAPLIMNFGRRMCGQRDDAEEVVQETLLKAYQSIRDLREPAALKSWVYRVAANACLKMRRKGKFEPERELSLDELLPRPNADGSPPEIPDWSDLPLEQALRAELREKIESAILRLPKEFRIVVVLRDQEGFSTRETSEILGIGEPLVKVRLHRARLALRRDLEQYMTGDRP